MARYKFYIELYCIVCQRPPHHCNPRPTAGTRRWWECVAASQVRQDGQPVGIVEVTGDRCCYPGSDDRLIIDYHVTVIGYGKKTSFTSLIEILTSLRPISFFIDWRPMVIMNVCQVLFIRGSGILICGDSVEEAFHLAFNVMSAIEIQVCCCMCLNHTSIVSKIWYSIIYIH